MATICGLNRQTVEDVHRWSSIGFAVMALNALIWKIQGLAAGFFSGGSYTTLGALIASSPYFLVPFVLLGIASVASYLALKSEAHA